MDLPLLIMRGNHDDFDKEPMRIAFVSLYEAYPPISGAASVTYNCARLTPGSASLLVQLCGRTSVEQAGNLTVVSLPQRGTSRFGKFLSMPRTLVQVRREIVRFRPDWVVLEGASWAVYLWLVAALLRATVPGVKLAYHAHNIEYVLRKNRETPLAVALTRRAEGAILRMCDRSFAVSQEDSRQFLSLYGILPDVLPNGVNCTEGRSTADEIAGAKEKFGITDEAILFMGLYGYPPNMEAVRFLTQQVMPELYRRRPDARLVVTGGGPSLNVPWMINAGIVPRQELNALLGACRIGVAPIFKGSGTRLKILEYMAAGLPVVSTRKGAEGLNLEEGKHVLYAETGAEFQSALLSLLSDRPLSQHLSDCAAELVRSEFDWAPLLDRFGSQLGAG